MSKILWCLCFFSVFLWSAIAPHDRVTWILETLPAIIGVLVLAITYNSFRFTYLVYLLILLHCVILMVGGHYTYAEVPLFDLVSDVMGWERNNYDKVGHFAQGFIPVMIAREIVIRKKVFNSLVWRNFFIVCWCLAFSAFYELIEWWVAMAMNESSEYFLGTQGYIWDTQSDMLYALLGSLFAVSILGKIHDRQLQRFIF